MTRNCTWESDGWSKIEPIDARARLTEDARRERVVELLLQAFARVDVLGDDDNFRIGFVGQGRIDAEPEAWRPMADITCIKLGVRVAF